MLVHDRVVRRKPSPHRSSHLSPRRQFVVNDVGSKSLGGPYLSLQHDAVVLCLRGTEQSQPKSGEYCAASQQLPQHPMLLCPVSTP